MRRFPWRSVMPDEESQQTASPEDPAAMESSPARSYRSSTNSSIRGGGGKWFKSLEGSPSKSWAGTVDGGFGASVAGPSSGSGGVGTGGSETPISNKKMLKIGANVRFRGDVMECNTVVLCGRLQGFVETQRLIVKKGGQFIGDAKVEDADVYGSFEGALESTSKICVRSTGVITGTVVYKGMSMEDGGEVEGTLRCSNKPSRKQSRMAGEAVETAEKAPPAGMNDKTALVASASRSEEQQAGLGGSAAGASTTAPASPSVVGEATPEPGSQPWPSASAAIAAAAAGAAAAMGAAAAAVGAVSSKTSATAPTVATSAGIGTASGGGDVNPAAGVGPKSTSPLSVKWPPKQPGQGTGPAMVGTPRRGIPLPASSPSSRLGVAAPSPRKSPGLQQVQNIGPEAWEIFSAEEETSPGSITSAYAPPLAALEAVGKKVSASSTEATSEAPVGPEGSVSVAALIGTWPPASPANSKAWNRRTESVSPASGASPSAAPPAAPSSTIAAKPVLRKTFTEGIRPPPTAPAGRRHESQVQNHNQMGLTPAPASVGADVFKRLVGLREGVGIGGGGVTSGPGSGNASGRGNALGGAAVVAVSGGGTGSQGKGLVTCAGEGTGEAESGLGGSLERGKDTAASEKTEEKPLPLKKACESSNCSLEACWGDPRFRPRYCARHKRQGSKLMDPVELEEGDEAALPEGSPPPSERSILPSEAPRRVVKGGAPAAAAAGAAQAKGKSDSEVVGGSGRTWGGGESDDEDDDDDDEDEDEGWGNGGADPLVLNGTLGVGTRLSSDVDSVSGGENNSAPQQPRGQHQQPELELPPPQQPELEPEPQQPDPEPEPQQPDPEPQQPEPEPQQPEPQQQSQEQERQQPQEQQNQEADRRIDDAPGVSGEGSVDNTEEVQGPEPAYGRLARAMPSIKSKPNKPKKRPTGNNIADFYGGGAEDDSDDETSFSMESISKGARQSQGMEVGTHTDDGQPRPQASLERDKQRLMHLVKVNKIGTFRGKGVTAVGKRR